MEIFLQAISWFVGLGSNVVLPIIIFFFGLILGAKPGKAFVAGVTVGIGLIGLNLVIGLLVESLGSASKAMVEHMNLSLDTLDVGWPATAAISYATILGSLAIPIGLVLNIVLLSARLTRTLNIDIWNYWHAAFVASIVYSSTNDFALSIFTTVVYLLMIYLLADMIGGAVKKTYGFPNVTFPHGTSAPGFWVGIALNKVFDHIPGFNRLEADPESIQRRFGIMGDNTVIGLCIGLIIGVLARYEFKDVLSLGVQTAAVMIIMPKMVALLMEGLIPISEAAGEFVKKHLKGQEIFIGMDSAISVGHPAVLSSSLLLVPITIFLAVILPGNKTLPFGDLATIPFIICLMVAAFKGNIIRTIVGGAVYMVSILYVSSWAAPLITSAAKNANFDIGNNSSITSLADGGLWTTVLYIQAVNYAGWIGIGLIGALCLWGLIYINRIQPSQNQQTGE